MFKKWISATLLISGTCIGGGILALPVETGAAGWLPSMIVITLSWIFMTLTGLYYAEANLWLPEGSHVMTMAAKILGPWGKWVALVLFLFIDYTFLVAYNAGGGAIVSHAFGLPKTLALFLFAFGLGTIVTLGAERLGRLNSLLVAGMVCAYLAILGFGASHIDIQSLKTTVWQHLPPAIPVVLTTFSFQMIIPSVTPYLDRDPRLITRAIIWGTSLPFAMYLLWQVIFLGILPLETLSEAYALGQGVVEPLRKIISSQSLALAAAAFAFFSIVTSFLGMGLSLFDFLSDSLKIPKKGIGKAVLGICVIAPSLFFSISYPRAFLTALEMTGGFGDSLLNGIIPIGMIWVGRYVKNLDGPLRIWGGKRVLICMALFAVGVIGIQISTIVGR